MQIVSIAVHDGNASFEVVTDDGHVHPFILTEGAQARLGIDALVRGVTKLMLKLPNQEPVTMLYEHAGPMP